MVKQKSYKKIRLILIPFLKSFLYFYNYLHMDFSEGGFDNVSYALTKGGREHERNKFI